MRKIYRFTLIFILAFFSQQLTAQITNQNSPYSFFGIGDLHNPQSALQRSMGNTGTAFRSPLFLNASNPASYTSLKLTVFETGLDFNGIRLNTLDETGRTSQVGLSYLNLGFPINKFWGASFGASPFSKINYFLKEDRINADETIGLERLTYFGTGGLQNIYIGSGFKYKGLSIGFNTHYVFGSTTKFTFIEYLQASESFDVGQSVNTLTNGFLWNLGAQYEQKLPNKNLMLTVGGTYQLPTTLETESSETWERGRFNDDALEFSNFDTIPISFVSDIEGSIDLPARYSAGITLNDTTTYNQWRINADFEFTQWENYRINGESSDVLQNSFKIAVGASITPDINDINNYFKRLNYRLGAYYNSNNLQLRDTDLPEYGLTLGLGLPLRFRNDFQQFARLNLSFDIGQRGSTDQNLISENYVKTTIGFTFNSKWFVKKKYY